MLAISLCGVNGSPSRVYEVDLIEVNHHFGTTGKNLYNQIILWDFDGEYYVREYRLIRNPLDYPHFSNGKWWILSNRRISVYSTHYRETFSLIDPEVENRKLCPTYLRKAIRLSHF